MDVSLRELGLLPPYPGISQYFSLHTYPGSKMVEVKFTLLRGKESYQSYTERIPSEISYTGLQHRVNNRLHVRPCYQQIYFRGEELPVVEHPLKSVKDGEEISIKHSLYDHWPMFEQHSHNARQALNLESEESLVEHLRLAFCEHDLLNEASFFSTFWDFSYFAKTFFLDITLHGIEQASTSYFSTLYGDDPECRTLNIELKPKREKPGIQFSLRCYVYREKTLLKTYYVRIHTKLAEQHDNKKSADLRVLFMFKLLEILRFGPKVHFYRNSGQLRFGFYTASAEVPGFQSFFNRSDYGTITCYQMRLLSFCLYLRDVVNYKKNYGIDSNGRLQIIHFQLRSHIPNAEHQANMYCHHYQNETTKIGKACLAEWNLLSCIDMADKAIEKEKKLFEDHSFKFGPERDYDEYLTKIRSNVRYFTALFDRLEPPMSLVARCLRSVDPDQINFPLRNYHSFHHSGKKLFFRKNCSTEHISK